MKIRYLTIMNLILISAAILLLIQLVIATNTEQFILQNVDVSSDNEEKRSMPPREYAEPSRNRTIRALSSKSAAISVRSPAEYLISRYRRGKRETRVAGPNGSSYHCYKAEVKVGDEIQINRGCIHVLQQESACQAVDNKYAGQVVESCNVCSTGECNGSIRWTMSFYMLSFFSLARILF